jgi:hypothetical protein
VGLEPLPAVWPGLSFVGLFFFFFFILRDHGSFLFLFYFKRSWVFLSIEYFSF